MQPLLWLEDFNERIPELPRPSQDTPVEAEPEYQPDPRAEAWTEGFLAGCRINQQNDQVPDNNFATDLTRRLLEIEEKLDAIANLSAVAMGGLLIDMLADALPPDWPGTVAERLQAVTDAIRPVFMMNPKLQVHADPPGEIDFRDLPGFYKALQTSHPIDCPLGVRWQPAASPNQVIEDLKAAITGTN